VPRFSERLFRWLFESSAHPHRCLDEALFPGMLEELTEPLNLPLEPLLERGTLIATKAVRASANLLCPLTRLV
jgi:hypothetical protein